jgi:hypothetical protein
MTISTSRGDLMLDVFKDLTTDEYLSTISHPPQEESSWKNEVAPIPLTKKDYKVIDKLFSRMKTESLANKKRYEQRKKREEKAWKKKLKMEKENWKRSQTYINSIKKAKQ